MNTSSRVRPAPGRLLAVGALLLTIGSHAPVAAAADAPFCQPGQTPQFTAGFAALKAQLDTTMGDPIECEHPAAGSADTLQQTTTGLAFYRASTNTPTFTDGASHWALVDGSLVAWTGASVDPPGAEPSVASAPSPTAAASPAATPAPVATPSPTAASSADVVNRVAPSVVQVLGDQIEGSGVVVDGGVLTNAHVVEDARHIQIATSDQRKADATIVRLDDGADLALLHTDLSLPALDIEPAGQQQRGDEVLAIGYPLGLRDGGGQATITRGVISDIRTLDGSEQYVQTDAAINSGNSGGALVNMRGKLIGLATMRADPSVAQGVAFGIGPDTLLAFLSLPADAARPTPPSPLYRGDPRDLACPSSVLGDGWQTVSSDTSHLKEGRFTTVLTVYPSDIELGCVVDVLPNTRLAREQWTTQSSHLDDGYAAVPIAALGDASMAEANRASNTLVVRAREKNVIAAVVVKTSQYQSDTDAAVGLLRAMLDKANSAAN